MFADRTDAGRKLADRLRAQGVDADIVLGLTRGGVPVASVVADALDCPLDAIVVQKIGAPGHEELALGAVTADGTAWLNERLLGEIGIDEATVATRREAAATTAAEKARRYRDGGAGPSLAGKHALVVDDGVATGATARVAIADAHERGATRVTLAVPVASPRTLEELRERADEVICIESPQQFGAVGQFYADFGQVSDDEVRALLD